MTSGTRRNRAASHHMNIEKGESCLFSFGFLDAFIAIAEAEHADSHKPHPTHRSSAIDGSDAHVIALAGQASTHSMHPVHDSEEI